MTTHEFEGHHKSSQECQHVHSSDIRLYNNKLLGTSPALQQEAALPANFMLRSISSSAPGFEAGVRLLQGGRRPSTVKSYDQKWLKFEAFTSQVQDDAGAPRMSALPVSSQTVIAYLAYLLESDTISTESLQPYLSAINAVHNDFEYSPPAYGNLVKLAGKGFAELQVLPCCNRSKSRCFQQNTCLLSFSSGFDLTLLSTTFACVRVWWLNSPSSVVLIQVFS